LAVLGALLRVRMAGDTEETFALMELLEVTTLDLQKKNLLRT
jgi:hypothetical protein